MANPDYKFKPGLCIPVGPLSSWCSPIIDSTWNATPFAAEAKEQATLSEHEEPRTSTHHHHEKPPVIKPTRKK